MMNPSKFSAVSWWAFAPLLLALLALPQSVQGQTSRSFKAGDDVLVFFLNKWWPAKVVETNKRGDILAEFEFAGGLKRDGFNKSNVRYAYEADAMAPSRSWSDQSGQFKIRAALLRLDEDSITLRREDMKEIKVPIAKLSEADQAFLKRLKKELGPAAARAPEAASFDSFDRSAAANPVAVDANIGRKALTPDPLPSGMRLEEGGVAFGMDDFFDRLGAVLPLGGADSWLLAAVENEQRDALGTRLLWASLAKKEIAGRQMLPPGEIVLDYHQASRRLLTYSTAQTEERSEVETLTIWEVLPSDKQATLIVRWNAGPEDRPTREPWARLITGELVLHRWKDHEYVAWDVAEKRLRYRIAQESFFAPLPTLSGGRKYLFLPEDKRVTIYEAVSGNVACILASEDGASGIAVTEDGQRAAVLGRNTLTIWNLTNPSVAPQKIQAEAIGNPFRARIDWVDDQHLMSESPFGQVLFSLPHKLALWNYQFDLDAVREKSGRRLRDIVAGHLVYAASVRSGNQRGLAVGAVRLPGPKVMEAAATLDPDSLMVVKPGTPVRLDVRAGADSAKVQAALQAKILENGWTISPSANIVVTAEMKQGQTQQVTYRSIGFGPGEQSVSITPFISELKIEGEGKVLWQTATSSGAPPFLSLQEGQSVQNEVNKWQRPDPDFFNRVTIPQRILHPDKRNGIGKTQVTNRGLIAE